MFDKIIKNIGKDIQTYKEKGRTLFATSSFQTNSVVLLHIISCIAPDIPVYMLNTGYLFPETLAFKEQLVSRLNLNVIELFSSIPKLHQKDENGRLLFTSDPDYCCQVNKIQPLEPILERFDVWINGVRASQSHTRANMKKEERVSSNTVRYHPILQWTNKMVYDYIKENQLPVHPMEKDGYLSIGCQPCTRKIDLEVMAEKGRDGRWFGQTKVECGLHTDLIEK